MQRSKAVRGIVFGACLVALLLFASRSGALQTVLDIITGHNLPAQGAPVPATHARLSEHERQYIEGLPPQQQAEQLLQAAINHDEGATGMIMDKLPGWNGHLDKSKTMEILEQTALYSNDLRVRAAMIEVDLVAYKIEKSNDAADRLMQDGRQTAANRPFDAWVLGMLANRGVETDRIHDQLREWSHDPAEQTRFWAVEGLAHLGTDDTISEFIDVLRNDPAMDVRERAGCSLAKSGMLTREQRMKAVPGLIEIAGDPAVDDVTRNWAFQALREIANEALGNDASAWRNWFAKHGSERTNQFRQEDRNQVLGNS
jgi:HEAT repeat protein